MQPVTLNNAASNTALPFIVAMLGISTFASMDVLMKGLAIELGAYNAMFWRTSIALVFSSLLFIRSNKPWPEKTTLRLHVWRGVITSVMAFLFFWGLVYVPLAEAIGLSFIAPLIALYLASVMLKEKIGRKAIFASVIGLLGTIVIVGSKFGADYSDSVGMGIAAILLSALLYAYNLILQRQQALIAGPIEIAFFQNGTVVVVYLFLAPFLAVIPDPDLLPHLVVAAMLGIVSLLLISWAYARAEARILVPVEYTAFIWAALFGWLAFDEEVTIATLVGTALIVIGCLVAARQKPGQVEHIETTSV